VGRTDHASTRDDHPETDRGATYRSVWRSLVNTDFRQGHVRAAGLGTRYVEAGSPADPAVIMLHGTGGHWETFSANIPVLAASFRCLALDMVGCGFTDRPDRPYEIGGYVDHVLAFMDVMGVATASVIGVSLGSWVAARLAVRAPDRVDKLILNSPAGLLPLSASASAALDARRDVAADPSWDNTEQVLAHLFYDRRALTDDIIAVRQQVYRRPDASSLSGRTLTLFDPEVRRRNLLTPDEWASISAPTLIIAHVDAPDDYLTTGRAIAELMPAATVADVPRAGHWPHFEQADVFNAIAADFLRHGRLRPQPDAQLAKGS
jgi:2-hydroxy-6-oxonona-2,4-dienedioate hydrolase